MAGSTTEIPLFPLRTVLFPGMELPLRVFEPRYKQMLRDVVMNRTPFGVVLIRSGSEVGGGAVPYEHGTQALIEEMEQIENGQILLQARGSRRFRVVETLPEAPYPRGIVEFLDDSDAGNPGELASGIERVRAAFPEYFRLSLALTDQWARAMELPDHPHELVNTLGPWLQVDEPRKQELIAGVTARERVERLAELLEGLVEVVRTEAREHYRQKYFNIGVRN